MTVFCIGIKFSIVSAMDQAIIKQVVTFKSLEGFPCSSLNRFNKKKDDLSEGERQNIRKQLYDTGQKKLLVLFNIVTLLPFELQKKIVMDVCNDNEGANFLTNPW